MPEFLGCSEDFSTKQNTYIVLQYLEYNKYLNLRPFSI